MAEKTVVAKALEAFGHDMQQEAANELVRLQRPGFLPGLVAIILVAKTDLAVVDVEQAMVGDGHAVGITPQVIQDLFRTPEGWFGVNHPLAFAQRGQILSESFRVTESRAAISSGRMARCLRLGTEARNCRTSSRL